MSCLHLLNKSPASGLLKELHKALSPGDGLLLLEDGVFYLSRQQELAELPVETSLYFLEPGPARTGPDRGAAGKVPGWWITMPLWTCVQAMTRRQAGSEPVAGMILVDGKQVKLDKEGYLRDLADWGRERGRDAGAATGHLAASSSLGDIEPASRFSPKTSNVPCHSRTSQPREKETWAGQRQKYLPDAAVPRLIR